MDEVPREVQGEIEEKQELDVVNISSDFPTNPNQTVDDEEVESAVDSLLKVLKMYNEEDAKK